MAKSKKRVATKESKLTSERNRDDYNSDSYTRSHVDNVTDKKDMIWIDPMHIRFQHSKIRPVFSSCGRTLMETLNSIRNNEISPMDLPPIQVLVGPESDDGQHRWYFSLNNRRLWVLKRCREEGLLETTNNQILVRLREPKSRNEKERYSIHNCAVEAKVIPERVKERKTSLVEDSRSTDNVEKWKNVCTGTDMLNQAHNGGDDKGDASSSDESSSDCDKCERNGDANRFSALF